MGLTAHAGLRMNMGPDPAAAYTIWPFSSWVKLKKDPGFLGGSVGKNLPANAGDMSSIPGSGRSPGEGNGYPFSILAWEIPRTEEPGSQQSTGSQIVGYD